MEYTRESRAMDRATDIIDVGGTVGTFSAQVPSQPHKNVTFRWQQARLPLRVRIKAHDSVESIISTVKNFYGLYEGEGISFEDSAGGNIIPHYENLKDQSSVHVCVIPDQVEEQTTRSQRPSMSSSPRKPVLDEPFEPKLSHSFNKPELRSPWMRSTSPSAPQNGARNGGPRSFTPSRNRPVGSFDDENGHALSDSDAEKSVSSSRRGKNDLLASAEISVDNIVEGGRRKRAKFESSELPLFIPPQLPFTASMSSASPQRRIQGNAASPYGAPGPFPYALPSPYSLGASDHYAPKMMGSINGRLSTGNLSNGGRSSARQSTRLSGYNANGILPTPDPTTVGSVISDEDVALQLMRLGDVSNLSHGRKSTDTVDDALSGKAEAPSSEEDSEDEMEEHHSAHHGHHISKKLKSLNTSLPVYDNYSSSEEDDDDLDDSFRGNGNLMASSITGPKPKARKGPKPASANKAGKTKTAKATSSAGSRKGSVSASMATHFAHDEEDLSSRPRCQRCRKSKKGCDRQRPCGRCVDAGIGIEGCVSEEEENGRKGRYGRHMGVAVKKQAMDSGVESPHANYSIELGMNYTLPSPEELVDNSKKRKR